MLKKSEKRGRRVLFAVIAACVFPTFSYGETRGQDWYCSEPEAHVQYEKHLKIHLDHEADQLTDLLAKIYGDSKLTAEQKKMQTMQLLEKYLSRMENGMGD